MFGGCFLWLVLWSMLLWMVGMLRGDSHHRQVAKVIFFPGFMLEAVLRGLACLITGTPIRRFNPVADGRPVLATGDTPIRHIGPPVLLTVRLLLVFAALYVALLNYPAFINSGFGLPLIEEASLTQKGVRWISLPAFLDGMANLPRQLELGTLATTMLLYVLGSCLIATGFRGKEFVTALYVWITLCLVTSATAWLGVKFGFLSRGWFLQFLYGGAIWSTFSLLVILTAACAGLLAVWRFAIFLGHSFSESRDKGHNLSPVKN